LKISTLLVGIFSLALVTPASAQNNTGLSGWSVNTYNVGTGLWTFNPSPYTPSGQPSVWQPNDAFTKTISAWSNFSASNGLGDYNHLNDVNNRYHYLFRYDFGAALGAGAMKFSAGWDNILKSFQFSNSSPLAPVSTYQVGSTTNSVNNFFGFCRTGDAIWNSLNAVCTADFSVPVAAGATWMQFEIWGDGQTDGMWLAWDKTSTPNDVVPEPATMTLLATGLIGMAAARRRRKNTAA
jgi:hypothetical protein